MNRENRQARPQAAAEPPTESDDSSTEGSVTFEDRLAAIALALIFLITFANVLVRYLTNLSFAWTEEISLFLMVTMTLFGAAGAASRDVHLRVEYFFRRGSLKRQRILALFSSAVTAIFFLALAWLAFEMLRDDVKYGETSSALGVPRWWYTLWLPTLLVVISYRAYTVFRKTAGQK